MTTQRLTLTPTQTAASEQFRKQVPALEFCTHVKDGPNGSRIMARNWPNFSTGQELLWQAVAHVNGYEERPAHSMLVEWLDSETVAVVEALLAGKRAA